MKMRIGLLALALAAALSEAALAWGPPRGPGFYVGIYGPPVYGPPVYPPPVYPAPVYPPPVYPPPVVLAPRRVYMPPPPLVAPGPPGYYYPPPGVGATLWFR